MSDTHTSTTVITTDEDTGNKNINKLVGLPGADPNYSALTGIFPGDPTEFTKMIELESKFAHNSFYGNDKDKYKVDNYIETVDLNNNEELKDIIEKIRVFLADNRVPFAKEFDSKHPGTFGDFLEKEPDALDPLIHKYEDFSDDEKASDQMKKVITLAELVFKILTKPNYVSDDTSVTFDRNDFDLSTEELNVLIPQHYNSFVYIVGQNFNIFSPLNSSMPANNSFYEVFDKLLGEMPSLIFSFGNRELMVKSFFESSVMKERLNEFGKSSKKEESEGYYVGQLNATKQKAGDGVMRWNNKSMFEGTFANDVIVEGNFTTFGGSPEPLKITNAATGAATLNSVAGTFDSVSGNFVLTSAVVSAIPGPADNASTVSLTTPTVVAVSSTTPPTVSKP